MNRFIIRPLNSAFLLAILLAASVILAGCAQQKPEPTKVSSGIDLSATLVPNMDLDAYAYVKQDNPTKIPKEIIGVPSDLSVESLAIWGVVKDDDFTVGAGLRMGSAAEAAYVLAQIPPQAKTWTSTSGNTLYVVYGAGAAAEQLKTAISKNDFKYYNDQAALQEAALLPNASPAKLAAVAVVKPNKAMVNLLAKYSDSRLSSMMDSLVRWGRVQAIAIGLCAPQQIDVADMVQKLALGTIWDSDLGIVASAKSSLPGFVVTPAASKFLENAGFAKASVGTLSVYKGSVNAANIKTVPVIISLKGSRIFATSSGKESYAATLITSVTR